MCSFVPFVNTATIMASSLILVAIAVDRYMAIQRAGSSIWNPGRRFCACSLGGICCTSLLCGLPLFFISDTQYIYIQLSEDLELELQLATVCLGMQVSEEQGAVAGGKGGRHDTASKSIVLLLLLTCVTPYLISQTICISIYTHAIHGHPHPHPHLLWLH